MAMNNVDDDLLNVRDLGLAAALICVDYKAAGTRQDETGRVYFFFLKSGELQEAVDRYWAYQLHIDARQYSEALKSVKSQIYNERGSG
jgi:hypothetical protein